VSSAGSGELSANSVAHYRVSEHRAAFARNPPRFHATIEQRRLQRRFEALDLPCDRRRRQEQPFGCPLQRT